MAALTRAVQRLFGERSNRPPHSLPADNASFFEGAALMIDASGNVVPLNGQGSFHGFCLTTVDLSNGTAGATMVQVVTEGTVRLELATATAASVGSAVSGTTDNDFVLGTPATSTTIGTVVSFEGGECVVEFKSEASRDIDTGIDGSTGS